MQAAVDEQAPPRVNWRSVITYYVVACAFSWPFFWWRDMEPESWAAWGAPAFLKTMSYMWGPAIAALLCLFLFRRTHWRTITSVGGAPARSAAFFLLPALALCAAYAPEIARGDPTSFVLKLVIGAFILTVGEELGWRGFLQDALRPLPKISRYALLGVMWELWHFTNRIHEGSAVSALIRVSIWIVILIVVCWIIGEAVERSKSIVVAVTLHAWINIMASVSDVFDASPMRAFIVLGGSILLWLYLLKTWPSKARPEG